MRGCSTKRPSCGALPFADLAQNLGAVLAEPRRWPLRRHRRPVQYDWRANAGNDAALRGRAFQFEPHAAVDDLRIGEHLLQIVDRTRWYAGGFELVQKLFAFPPRGQRAQFADEFGAMADAAFIVFVQVGLGQFRGAENAAQFDELRVVSGGDDDAAVRDRKFLIRNEIRMRIADALGKLAGDEIIERLERKRADRGIDQRRIDVTAAPGFLPPHQRRKNADRGIDAGKDIGDRYADAHRWTVGGAGHAHDAAIALRHQVISRTPRRGTGLPETGHRAIDQPRIGRAEALIVETEFGEAADLEILDQHIGPRGDLLHQTLALGRGEIQFNGTLAAVGAMEIGRIEVAAVGARHERRAPGPGIVAIAAAFDLDHVGAKVGEDLSGPRTGQNAGEFEYAQSSQGARHDRLHRLHG